MKYDLKTAIVELESEDDLGDFPRGFGNRFMDIDENYCDKEFFEEWTQDELFDFLVSTPFDEIPKKFKCLD